MQEIANAEAAGVSKDDLDPSKGLLHAVAGKGEFLELVAWFFFSYWNAGYLDCVKTLVGKARGWVSFSLSPFFYSFCFNLRAIYCFPSQHQGAEVNGLRKDGWSALACAAAGGQAQVCDYLIQRSARVNEVIKETVQIEIGEIAFLFFHR